MFEPRSETFPSFSSRPLTTTPSTHLHLRLSSIFAVSLHEGISFSVLLFLAGEWGARGGGVPLSILGHMLTFVQQHFGRMFLEKTTAKESRFLNIFGMDPS